MIFYKVYITPMINSTTYGEEVDVTEKIDASGVGSLNRQIDATDFDIGVYVYSDITLSANNKNGFFTLHDSRSLFTHSRDKAKVKIIFVEAEITKGDNVKTETISFEGIINDEATVIDPIKETIRFKVLSKDSVLKKDKLPAGAIASGVSAKTALEIALNRSEVTRLLNFDENNINPANNIIIDDGSKFDSKNLRTIINEILLATNSVMIIDSDFNIIVKSRDNAPLSDGVLLLYAHTDIHKRENIIDIKKYNDGRQRMFTSIIVNNQEFSDDAYAQEFGVRQKEINLDFLTDNGNEVSVATAIVNEFKTPKIELEVSAKTSVLKEVDLLDLVSVNMPYRVKPESGNFLPVLGITTLGETSEPLPRIFGTLKIDQSTGFKVIGINEDPQSFTTTLKLREIGTKIGDNSLSDPENAVLGFAILGASVLQFGITTTWDTGILGAGIINGLTKIGEN